MNFVSLGSQMKSIYIRNDEFRIPWRFDLKSIIERQFWGWSRAYHPWKMNLISTLDELILMAAHLSLSSSASFYFILILILIDFWHCWLEVGNGTATGTAVEKLSPLWRSLTWLPTYQWWRLWSLCYRRWRLPSPTSMSPDWRPTGKTGIRRASGHGQPSRRRTRRRRLRMIVAIGAFLGCPMHGMSFYWPCLLSPREQYIANVLHSFYVLN